MRTMLFLSRVAVLMNVMFLLFLAGYFQLLPTMHSYLQGFIVTTGVVAFIVNLVLHPFLLVMIMLRKQVLIPVWILGFNLLCFILQIFFYFFT